MDLRLKTLVLVSTVVFAATPADACWLFGGGRWGAYRPLSWTGYYRGWGWGGGWGAGCCDPCGSVGACGTSCCAGGSCGTGGCCGTSYYGPGIGCCGDACSSCGTACGGACGTPTYSSTSNCCAPYNGGSEPIPDGSTPPTTPPASDNFQGVPGSSIPKSSIPKSSIPSGANSPASSDWNSGTGEYGGGRGTQDQPMTPAGGDAPAWQLPRTPNDAEPIEPNLNDAEPIRIEPLEVDSSLAFSFRPARERVRLWSNYRTPQVAAKALPSVNEGWEPVETGHIASR